MPNTNSLKNVVTRLALQLAERSPGSQLAPSFGPVFLPIQQQTVGLRWGAGLVPKLGDGGGLGVLGFRGYRTGALWESLTSLPSRVRAAKEAETIASLLPKRGALSLQFSPHGVTLVPTSILEAQPRKQEVQGKAGEGEVATATMALQPLKPEQMEMAGQGSTKVWRRLKMKKHKINKRRKAVRFKVNRS